MKTRITFLVLAIITLGILMIGSVYGGTVADFTQCANDNINGVPPGPCDMIGSNSQSQKAQWSDGMADPQRIYFQNINTATVTHTVDFQWQWSKNSNSAPSGSAHAYDFLVSWDQAKQLSYLIRGLTMTIGYNSSNPSIDDPCENLKGGDRTDCLTMHGGSGYHSTYAMPDDDPFNSSSCDPGLCSDSAKQSLFTSIFGPRTITIWALQPITITGFSLAHTDQGGVTLVPTDVSPNQDSYVTVVMTYTSTSSQVIIETAPHIGLGCSPNQPSGLDWGCLYGGASAFSGSPYHFQNPHIDGSTGSMDNQIDVKNFPPTLVMSTQLSRTGAVHYGTPVTDTLTISGTATIAGTVLFYTCGPTASPISCIPASTTNQPLGTTPINVNPTNSGATTFTLVSPEFTVSSGIGYYCFRAEYTSANTNNESSSAWSSTNECVYFSDTPTRVTLSSLGAKRGNSQSGAENSRMGITLEWTTASEIDTAGFHIYRSDREEGPYTRLNARLIPTNADPLSGGKYEFQDTNALMGQTYYYQLEDVGLDGTNVRHKPIVATAATESEFATNARLVLVFGLGALVLVCVGAYIFLLRNRLVQSI